MFSPFNAMVGATVSMVTKEPVSRSLSVKETRPPLEFVTTIENVTFPLVSLGETVSVNSTVPLFTSFLIMSLPSKVPVKLPRLLLSVWSLRVIVLPSFAKLELPGELVILSDVIPIRGASIIVDADSAQTITRIVEVLDAPPITITNLAIESSNSNSSYAKAGDTLDIDLTINYTITSYTITIFNTTTSVASYNSPIISLAETVPSDQVEEYTKFSITVIDATDVVVLKIVIV